MRWEFQLVDMDKENPHSPSPPPQKKFGYPQILLTAGFSCSQRLSRLWMGSSNPKICWWFQTVTLFVLDLTQTSRLRKIHISLFFSFFFLLASTTSRISLKVQSHAGAEKRFRRGSVQTSAPFTGRLTAQRHVRRGRGAFCTSATVF